VPAVVSLQNCQLSDNGGDATVDGGAVYAQGGEVTLGLTEMYGNRATSPSADGGAVVASVIHTSQSYLHDNTASWHGGALLAATLDIRSSWFTDNATVAGPGGSGDSYGGAVWGTNISIAGSEFDGNAAAGGGAVGAIGGDITASSSSFFGNGTDSSFGGAIRNVYGKVDLYDSTLVGNRSTYGSGFMAAADSTLIGDTFVENSAVAGGPGLTGSQITAANSIFSYQTTVGCIFVGAVVDNGGNFSSDGSCPGTVASSGELKLATPALYGVRVVPLHRGSVAMNAGIDAICAASPISNVDERGVARDVFGSCDSGAYEFTGPILETSTAGSLSAGPHFIGDGVTFTVSINRLVPVAPTAHPPLSPATGQATFYYCFNAAVAPTSCDAASGTQIGSPITLATDGTATLSDWVPAQGVGYYLFFVSYGGDDYSLPSAIVIDPVQVFSVTLRPVRVVGRIEVSSSGADVTDLYDLEWQAPPVTLTTEPTCATYTDGSYSTLVKLDASTRAGSYVVHCSGAALPEGWSVTYTDGLITIRGELPATGANTGPLVLAAGVLLGLGAVLLVAVERRKRRV
jgi:LPXTG-motif cell wall-anchored protein